MNGIAAASGLASGQAFVYVHTPIVAKKEYIGQEEVPHEISEFHEAVSRVSDSLEMLVNEGVSQEILETHLLMLSDPEFTTEVDKQITSRRLSASWAVETVCDKMVKILEGSDDPLFKERAIDFKDVSIQIIEVLLGEQHHSLNNLMNDVILVGDALLPSELFSMDKKHVLGIALDGGGKTSHIAILVRSLRIPTVLALGNLSSKVHSGDEIIVDGNFGEVIVRPDWSTSQRIKERYALLQDNEQKLTQLAKLPTVTLDGHTISLLSNIEMASEIPSVKEVGSEGIGLYRSEFLLINNGEGVSEELQFETYRKVVEDMAPREVTIRTFDIGGDKVVPGLGIDEQNPILGWRAVRFCLARKDIFLVQLRSLLRASSYGKLRIMFPMISGIEELDDVLAVLQEAKKSLDQEQVPYDHDLKVGTMIEVPAAALCADILAKKVDFFSIGTNDLIQYTLAVDRGNEKIAYLYQPFHPAVLRSIKMVIDKAHEAHIPVGMCGEMAGDSSCAVLLAGLGLDEFSMDPQSVLQVRKVLRSVTYEEAKQLSSEVMRLDSYQTISMYIRKWMHDRFEQ
ncbi:MAG: phosphoenolpyruvate--protein phosphotransferase [Sphaerochaetaceae bacterium]